MISFKNNKSKHINYFPIKSLLFIVVLQLFSHQSHTPIWLTSFIVILLFFKMLAHKSNAKKTPFILRFVLIVSSSATFISYYKTSFSVDMAASFLLLASALKLLELEKMKDVQILLFSMIYLSAVSFLFEQSILQTLLQIMTISICFYCLLLLQVGVGSRQSYSLSKYYSKSILKTVLIAIPIVIILFLFFPRISPLWQMPLKTQTAKSGISGEMSPGDISSLAKSSAPAFRVTFDSLVPDKASLYWRGLILDEFDGRKWKAAFISQDWVKRYKVDPGNLYETNDPSYLVILEPHQQKWAFSLEGSMSSSSNLIKSEMGLYRLKTDATQATRYKMSLNSDNKSLPVESIPATFSISFGSRNSTNYRQDLQLPSKSKNPRTQQYVQQLNNRFTSDEHLIAHLLNRFQEEPFFYTLEPPALGENFVDEFLFDTKKGFCGHYAGSFAYMLRLAGIPARVVIGYQGGEFNTQSDYMIVSQSDAHAWVEAFIAGKGWLRIDPTAMVSPLRISEGSSRALESEQGLMDNSLLATAALKFGALNWLRLKLDDINYQWQNVVVNYNQDQQKSLFVSFLGENSLLRVALFFVYTFIIAFVLMLLYLWFKSISGYSKEEGVM